MRRLDTKTASARPEREVELAEIQRDIASIKTAILKGVDASMFVAELRQLETRRRLAPYPFANACAHTTDARLMLGALM